MKAIFREQKNLGLTRIDVVVLVLAAVLLLFIAMAVPVFAAAHRRDARITCVSNLRQLGMSLRVWEDNIGNTHGSRTSLLETNAQTLGLNAGQVAWINAMMGCSNALTSAKILQCPADKETPITTNAAGAKIRISYFLNLDAKEGYPPVMMAGDDNIALDVAGSPALKPGILVLSSNTMWGWTKKRHIFIGNIALADGSVDLVSSSALQNAAAYSLNGTPFATNRLAIP